MENQSDASLEEFLSHKGQRLIIPAPYRWIVKNPLKEWNALVVDEYRKILFLVMVACYSLDSLSYSASPPYGALPEFVAPLVFPWLEAEDLLFPVQRPWQ